jgi:LEA14-like dessication related protein
MTIKKKYVVAGALTLVSITGALAYLQYKKIMNYKLKMLGMRDVNITKDKMQFNIIYDYKNEADIDVTLLQQEYDIYINDIFITKMYNFAPNVLKASQSSEIVIHVDLNFSEINKKLGKTYAQMILDPESVVIRTDMKWKVKLLGFLKIPVGYTMAYNLKTILGWYLKPYRK